MHVVWTVMRVAAFATLPFALMMTAGHAGQKIPAAEFLKQLNLPSGIGQVWEGTITFTQNDSKRKHIDESTLNRKKETVDNRSIDASATVNFCGSGRFYVSNVQRTWKEQWEQGHIDAYEKTICTSADADGKSKPEPVSPGNENSKMEIGRGVLCPQAEKNQNGGKTEWFGKKNYELGPKGAIVSMKPAPYHGGY